MNNQELLHALSQKISSGELQAADVMKQLHLKHSEKKKVIDDSHFSVAKMLYVLGATIVLVGIIFFVSQVWNDIGSVGRIAVTLGLGLLFTAIGSILTKEKPEEKIGMVFHIIGALLVPSGAMVMLSEFHVETTSLWPVTITFGVITLMYALLMMAHKSYVLTFFTIANGTTFVYLLVESMIDGYPYQHEDLYAYLTMAIGIGYLLLSYSFKKTWNSPLIGILYFFGAAGFFGAAYSRVFDSVPWQMLYFLLVMGGLYLAVLTRSRSILVVSTIFLIAHVVYITSEYFADSIGWPISLVLLGFIFIGLGYASLAINKKYMMKK